MNIISVQSQSGGTGVTLTAAELALTTLAEGQRVLAIDTSLQRCLKDDIAEAGFHYLDDVRQLFRPPSQARWKLDPMPRSGLLCYPEAIPHYLSQSDEGVLGMGYAARAGQEARAAFNMVAAMTFFHRHYDMVIVDVANKDKHLMQLFYDLCDEVHVMLRDGSPHCRSVDDWRGYIDRPDKGRGGPKIIAHGDRNHVRGDLDEWGKSIALKPFIHAARNWRSPKQTGSQSSVLQ